MRTGRVNREKAPQRKTMADAAAADTAGAASAPQTAQGVLAASALSTHRLRQRMKIPLWAWFVVGAIALLVLFVVANEVVRLYDNARASAPS
jgi:type VI protein secretion system component VasF